MSDAPHNNTETGAFLCDGEMSGGSMSVKSAEEYRAQARSVRQLAETLRSPEERQTLLDIAESYERLAQQADKLASVRAGVGAPPKKPR